MDRTERDQLLAQVRDWFDEAGQVDHYSAEARSGPSPAENILLAGLPAPPAAVLDIGCGAGRIALPLSKQGYQVTGVDVSEVLLETARGSAARQGLTARFQVVDPLILSFDAEMFDAALALKVYCYIPSKESRVAYLAEIARVLLPGAALLLTGYVVPTSAAALGALVDDDQHHQAAVRFSSLEALDTFTDARGYVHWFTADALLAELSDSAFTLEQRLDDPDGLQVLVTLRKR
jgi:SAM-dependent methyltransferase